jgi:hypothetical protein
MSWSTASTQLAAVYAGLGFVVTTRETEIIELNSRINLRYYVSATSSAWPALDRDLLREHWDNGGLLRMDPQHPFLCGMAGVKNMVALLDHQHTDAAIGLVKNGGCYEYKPGIEDPRLKLSRECVRSQDLPLMAAMGVLGFPVIDIEGDAPRRTYILSNRSHTHLSDVVTDRAASLAAHLIRRAAPGKLPLAIEAENPQHPLCLAYNGSHAYAKMTAHIRKLQRMILLKAPQSSRRALIPQNASDKLLDEVGRHFRIQP